MTTGTVEPKGLGGWLILLAIGLLILPVPPLTNVYNDYLSIFSEGNWEVFTTPGSEAYHHLWAPFIIFDMSGKILFILFNIVLIFLFFAKSYRFPMLFIIFLVSNILFAVSDFFFKEFIPEVSAESNTELLFEVARTIVDAMIWIPYFLVSKRVKNTFVKPEFKKG